jgi:predicted nucleotidyltransferase
MENLADRLNNIKESILKYVPAKYIYLFGSYAYGGSAEKSDKQRIDLKKLYFKREK